MKKNKNIIVCSSHLRPPVDAVVHWRDPLENMLFCLQYDVKQPPLADLLKRYHKLSGDWCVASPVYFHTTHNDSIISQCGPHLSLDEDKSHWYFDKVGEFLQEEGITLYYHSPTLWLAQLGDKLLRNSYAPSFLHNKSIMPYLEQLSDDMSWQKRITEIQMFLQTLHLTDHNETLFNGLWFWGQGNLSIQYDSILSDDANMMCLTDIWPDLNIQMSFNEAQLTNAETIILTQFTDEALTMIETVCRSYPCHWYWNNITYQQPGKRWWQKFWRKWS